MRSMVSTGPALPGRRHLMRGSCLPGTAGTDLSQPVAQIEGADGVRRYVGPVEEAPVDAAEVAAAVLLETLLDGEGAAGERLAGEPDGAETGARALRFGEQ